MLGGGDEVNLQRSLWTRDLHTSSKQIAESERGTLTIAGARSEKLQQIRLLILN